MTGGCNTDLASLKTSLRHNDLPWNIRQFVHNKIKTVNFSSDLSQVNSCIFPPKKHFQVSPWASSKWSHTDIPRLVKGKVGAQLWVAYSPCGSQHKDAVQITLEQIDLIKRLMADYSNHLQLVTTANGEKLKLSNGSKFPQNCRSGHRPPVWEDCRGGDSGVRPLHRHLSLRAQDVSSARSEVTRPHSQLQQPMVSTLNIEL